MSARRSLLAAGAVVAALTFGAAACSSDGNDSSATTTTASRSFQISTPAGEVSLSLDGQLPPGWPSDFPLPDGVEPAGSGSVAGSESGVMVGVFTTSQAAKDTLDAFSSEPSLSASDVKSTGVGSSFLGSLTLGGDWEGSVTVAGRQDSTYVVVVLTGASGAGGTGSTGGTGVTTTTTGASSAS
jgi:hypothetical protein